MSDFCRPRKDCGEEAGGGGGVGVENISLSFYQYSAAINLGSYEIKVCEKVFFVVVVVVVVIL